MKTKILSLIKTIFILFILCNLFSSCVERDGNKYDGLILTDENTGKKYFLKHNFNDAYFIDELVIQISGKDTTYVFK
jgi:hypothetical protein